MPIRNRKKNYLLDNLLVIYSMILLTIIVIEPSTDLAHKSKNQLVGYEKRYFDYFIFILLFYTFLTLGLKLYSLKKRSQLLYGILELMFAITTLAYTIIQFMKLGHYNFSFLASVYLLIRGFGNLDDGFKKSRFRVRVLRWFVKLRF